jgi:NADH:ubiquinone oxidoreductase subunit E
MPSDNEAVEIVVCYGTSCFARGNAENLDLLNNYAQLPGSNASVRLTGKLCQSECMDGPNLMICGKLYHGVTTERLHQLLQQVDAQLEAGHGTA